MELRVLPSCLWLACWPHRPLLLSSQATVPLVRRTLPSPDLCNDCCRLRCCCNNPLPRQVLTWAVVEEHQKAAAAAQQLLEAMPERVAAAEAAAEELRREHAALRQATDDKVGVLLLLLLGLGPGQLRRSCCSAGLTAGKMPRIRILFYRLK